MFKGLRQFINDRNQAKQFNRAPEARRQMVFYSEGASYSGYLLPYVDTLIEDYGLPVSFLTSDPNDPILDRQHPLLDSYSIGSGIVRTWLFRTLQCGTMAMTMPDLDSFHLRRSVYPVHYVYLPHNMFSTHMVFRRGAHHAYDTIFCVGAFQKAELREEESLYGLAPRQLEEIGYPRLDAAMKASRVRQAGAPTVLIAPTWTPGNLMESCGIELVASLLGSGLSVLLRPHRDSIADNPPWLQTTRDRFAGDPRFEIVDGRGDDDPMSRADLLVTDWSGAALSFAFGHEKPVLSIDVPPKVLNSDFNRFSSPAFEVRIRTQLGAVLPPEQATKAGEVACELLAKLTETGSRLRELRELHIYNPGRSTAAGAEKLHHLATIKPTENPVRR